MPKGYIAFIRVADQTHFWPSLSKMIDRAPSFWNIMRVISVDIFVAYSKLFDIS